MNFKQHNSTPINANELVAHRGYRGKYPENTILSLNKAIDHGALFIELDVQFSKDKLPIIYHDTNLTRVSGQDSSVFDLNRDTLIAFAAFEPERLGEQFIDEKIAPLEALVDVLLKNPPVIAFVEIKDESINHCGRELMLQEVKRILEPVAEQTVIMSFDVQLSIMAREADWPLVGVVLQCWEDLESEETQQAAPDFIYVDHAIIPDDYDLYTSDALSEATLVAYEVSDRALGYKLLARGVDMLETYEIEMLMAAD
jgi:glycerophosphoryl diester phosphodiesterase